MSSVTQISLVSTSVHDAHLREVSKAVEQHFIAEFLKYSGMGATPNTLGGGVGEEQFSSFLVNEYSKAIVSAGGIGLAEVLFNYYVSARGTQ